MLPNYVAPDAAHRALQDLADGNNVIILGSPGTGKTALLYFLRDQLKVAGGLPIFVPLRGVATSSDLVLRILDEIADLNLLATDLPQVQRLTTALRRSGRSADRDIVRRAADLLRHASGDQSKRLYLLLDGVDESTSPDRIFDFVAQLTSPKTNPDFLVAVTTRSFELAAHSVDRLARYQRFSSQTLGPLTLSDTSAFLAMRLGRRLSHQEVQSIHTLSGGSPLYLSIVASQFAESISPEQTTALLNRLIALTPDDAISEWIDQRFQQSRLDTNSRQQQEQILRLLTIFHPATASLLGKVSGLGTEKVIELLSGFPLVVHPESDTFEFAHLVVREAVIKKYLLPAGMNVSDLRFGDEAAERDNLLTRYVIRRPDIKAILSGEKTIVLGDRGSGKSAIFRLIADDLDRSLGEDAASVYISAERNPANVLQAMRIAGSSAVSAEEFRALWLFYAAAMIARTILALPPDQSRSARSLRSKALTILESFGWSSPAKETLVRRFARRIKRAAGVKVSFTVGPIKIEPLPTKETAGNLTKNRVEIIEFMALADDELCDKGKRLLVMFDQIDEAYKYDRKTQEAMIQGLLLAESFLSQTIKLRLVALLRTDLFDIYDIQEKNKFVSRTIRLEWNRSDLLSLLLSRLGSNASLSALAEVLDAPLPYTVAARDGVLRIGFPEDIERQAFVTWFFGSLENGNRKVSPRQIILFLNITRDRATRELQANTLQSDKSPRRLTLFTETSVADAMTRLSELSYEEVVSDFRVATAFVRNCRAAKIRDFDLHEVENLFEAGEGKLSEQVERLERLGFLERRVIRVGEEFTTRFVIPELFTRCWERAAEG